MPGWGSVKSECEYDGNWHKTSREREAGDGVGAGWWSESPTRDDKLAAAIKDLEAMCTSQSAMKKRLTPAENDVDVLYTNYYAISGQREEGERKQHEQRVARFKQWLKNLAIAMFAGGFIAVYWYE